MKTPNFSKANEGSEVQAVPMNVEGVAIPTEVSGPKYGRIVMIAAVTGAAVWFFDPFHAFAVGESVNAAEVGQVVGDPNSPSTAKPSTTWVSNDKETKVALLAIVGNYARLASDGNVFVLAVGESVGSIELRLLEDRAALITVDGIERRLGLAEARGRVRSSAGG